MNRSRKVELGEFWGRRESGKGRHTVTSDVAMLVLSDGEERGPAGEVLVVEIEVVVFCERVKIREVHL